MPFSDVLPKSETGIISLFKGIWVDIYLRMPEIPLEVEFKSLFILSF